MRITNQMLTNRYVTDLQNSLENLSKVQAQMTSQKEISKPSDDPAKVVKIMQTNTALNANTQYATNVDDATNYLNTADTTLSQATTILQRVSDLLVSSGNVTSADDKTAMKNEINQDIGQLGQLLNTKSGNSYIFGGTSGNTAPVTIAEAGVDTDGTVDASVNASLSDSDNVDNTKLAANVASGYSLSYGITASDLLNFKDSSDSTGDTTLNLKDVLSNIVNNLDGNGSDGSTDSTAATQLTTTDLTNIKDALSNISNVRSQEGTTINTLASIKDKNTSDSASLTDLLSTTQDIDITAKTMQYANMQNVYTATLQISAKVIQPSLMDYLK